MAGGQPITCARMVNINLAFDGIHTRCHLTINSISLGTLCTFCSRTYHKRIENTWYIVNPQDMFVT